MYVYTHCMYKSHFYFFLCVYLNKGVSEVKEFCSTSDNNSFLFLLSFVTLRKKKCFCLGLILEHTYFIHYTLNLRPKCEVSVIWKMCSIKFTWWKEDKTLDNMMLYYATLSLYAQQPGKVSSRLNAWQSENFTSTSHFCCVECNSNKR